MNDGLVTSSWQPSHQKAIHLALPLGWSSSHLRMEFPDFCPLPAFRDAQNGGIFEKVPEGAPGVRGKVPSHALRDVFFWGGVFAGFVVVSTKPLQVRLLAKVLGTAQACSGRTGFQRIKQNAHLFRRLFLCVVFHWSLCRFSFFLFCGGGGWVNKKTDFRGTTDPAPLGAIGLEGSMLVQLPVDVKEKLARGVWPQTDFHSPQTVLS